tara:strand:- start:4373 stop:4579 length:207 start_codon:yes stop_codon:yes gene_type:complete
MIEVDISGEKGNAFWLIAYAKDLVKQLNGIDKEYNSDEITNEMMSGDYNHLLNTFDRYFGDYVELTNR